MCLLGIKIMGTKTKRRLGIVEGEGKRVFVDRLVSVTDVLRYGFGWELW